MNGTALSAFAVARQPARNKDLDQAMYAPAGLTLTGGTQLATSAGTHPIISEPTNTATAY